MSTVTVNRHKWRRALSSLIVTLIAGAALLTALALGLADPPRAGRRIWQAKSAAAWPRYPSLGETARHLSPMPLPRPPFTLEISASNQAEPTSAWGIWLESGDGILEMLVSGEGYLSISTDENPHWAEFIHIHPVTNELYLHVESDKNATFRINDEIARTGILVAGTQWGVARFGNPDVLWDAISIYAPTS
jgi:hypothetical protein